MQVNLPLQIWPKTVAPSWLYPTSCIFKRAIVIVTIGRISLALLATWQPEYGQTRHGFDGQLLTGLVMEMVSCKVENWRKISILFHTAFERINPQRKARSTRCLIPHHSQTQCWTRSKMECWRGRATQRQDTLLLLKRKSFQGVERLPARKQSRYSYCCVVKQINWKNVSKLATYFFSLLWS